MKRRLCLRNNLLAAAAAVFFCLFAAHTEARAVWRAAGDVKSVTRQADGVVLTLTSGARVAVTFRDLEVVRVRFAPRGAFGRDFSYAVVSKDRTTVKAVISETRDAFMFSSCDGSMYVILSLISLCIST